MRVCNNLKYMTGFNSGKLGFLPFKRFKQIKYVSSSSIEFNSLIDVQKSVKDQILSGKPIVALESTIITHGMPYPNNLETALEVEEIVKSQGSYPATIAIVDGRIKVGLEKEELEILANFKTKKKDPATNTIKCSTRDLAYAISKKLCGGTTVAATLFIANKVGIKVFATGGIGGVHRNSQETLDVSTDLIELGKTPMAVVCSGVKSILDIPKTLEFLETQGVFVSSYQNSNYDFPAFYTRSSGCTVPYNLSNAKEAADLIKSLLELKLKSGILIGVAIPEESAIPEELINKAIDSALYEGKQKGIIGKDITPFVLDAVSKITKGVSLSSNMALIKNNAKIASQIANELYKIIPLPKNYKNIWIDDQNLILNGPENGLNNIINSFNAKNEKLVITTSNIPVVVGASILDITIKVEEDFLLNGATYDTETNISSGGVGRNIAEGIWKLYGNVHFISAVGNDDVGKNITNILPSHCTKGVVSLNDYTTSICNVIFDKFGECKLILGNMKIQKQLTAEIVNRYENVFKIAPLIIMDGNLIQESIEKILELSKKYNTPVFFEPTDMRLAHKPFNLPKIFTNRIKFISPNIFELQAISNFINNKNIENNFNINVNDNRSKTEILNKAVELLHGVQGHFDCIVLTLGSSGVIVDSQVGLQDSFFDENCVYKEPENKLSLNRKIFFFEAPKVYNLVNVLGAGDSFSSGFISAMLKSHCLQKCVSYGFCAAKDALQFEGAVPERYSSTENISKYEEIKF